MATQPVSPELQLAHKVGEFRNNPLGFVLFAYPWGQPGELEDYDGPDEWQREVLDEIGRQVRERAFNGTDPVAPGPRGDRIRPRHREIGSRGVAG